MYWTWRILFLLSVVTGEGCCPWTERELGPVRGILPLLTLSAGVHHRNSWWSGADVRKSGTSVNIFKASGYISFWILWVQRITEQRFEWMGTIIPGNGVEFLELSAFPRQRLLWLSTILPGFWRLLEVRCAGLHAVEAQGCQPSVL